MRGRLRGVRRGCFPAAARERIELALERRNVSLRASIHRARSTSGDGTVADAGAASRKRMQSIVTRRKLIDLARAQTDEIEFLRQELDRLRQRTFPSFATRTGGGLDNF